MVDVFDEAYVPPAKTVCPLTWREKVDGVWFAIRGEWWVAMVYRETLPRAGTRWRVSYPGGMRLRQKFDTVDAARAYVEGR